MAWLTGWSYRKSVTLSRASGAVTNCRMKLLVGESAGATGEDVDCGGKVLSTFNDLRFTKSDGTTLLDYWIESITGTTPNQLATVWIEFDSIGTGATTFYMYYGKAAAPSVSNRQNTFGTFTDFSQDIIGNDPAGFTDLDNVWSVQDDSGNVLKNSADGFIRWDVPPLKNNFIQRFKVKFVSGANIRWQVRFRSDGVNNLIAIGCIYSNNYIDIYEQVSGTWYRRIGAAYTYGTSFHDVEVVLQDTSIAVRIGATQIKFDTLTIVSGSVNPIFNANSGAIIEYDDLNFIPADNALDTIKDDDFNDNSLDPQWTISYGTVTGTSFAETGSELKYSGTPVGSGYVYIKTPDTSKRYGWLLITRFKAPTAIALGKEILYRMESDPNNLVEISIQASGYRVEKVENGQQPSGSVTDPIALFGNEATVFHTLKLLWEEFGKNVYGWIDNVYIGRLTVSTTTFPDKQNFILHLNNTNASAIDRRFDDFTVRSWRDGEPAWGAWGSEETETPPPSGTSFVVWIN